MAHAQPIAEISTAQPKGSVVSKPTEPERIGIVMDEEFREAARETPANYPRAFKALKKIVQGGEAEFQHNLAVFYDRGLASPQNFWKATYWYRVAAEQGFVESQYNLGVMYELGLGVLFRNNIQAYRWYFRAKLGGVRQAGKALSNLSKRMTEKELEKAKRKIA